MPFSKRKFDASRLTPGQMYKVCKPFEDYDGIIHLAGEQWRFVEKNFLPYDDGLSLHVEQDGQKKLIRLQWREEAQAGLIETFSDYLEEI